MDPAGLVGHVPRADVTLLPGDRDRQPGVTADVHGLLDPWTTLGGKKTRTA